MRDTNPILITDIKTEGEGIRTFKSNEYYVL